MESERLLAQALRAQVAGTSGQAAQQPTATAPPTDRPRRLAAGWVLLIALLLGLIGGAVAGVVSML